jgi:hypothetical protein
MPEDGACVVEGAGGAEHLGHMTSRREHHREQASSSPQFLGEVADRPAPPGE